MVYIMNDRGNTAKADKMRLAVFQYIEDLTLMVIFKRTIDIIHFYLTIKHHIRKLLWTAKIRHVMIFSYRTDFFCEISLQSITRRTIGCHTEKQVFNTTDITHKNGEVRVATTATISFQEPT